MNELEPVPETIVETVIEKPSYLLGGLLIGLSTLGAASLARFGYCTIYKQMIKGEKSPEEVLMDLKTQNALLRQEKEALVKKGQEDFDKYMETWQAKKKKKEEEEEVKK